MTKKPAKRSQPRRSPPKAAARPTPRQRSARFAVGAFMGLIVAVGYYMLEATMSSLGNHGHLAPMLAGWSAVCVFAAIVVLLARRLQNLQN